MAEHGPPRQFLDAWLEGRYILVISLYLIAELTHVLLYPRISQRLRLDDADHRSAEILASEAAGTGGG